jgi:hypothetical protein
MNILLHVWATGMVLGFNQNQAFIAQVYRHLFGSCPTSGTNYKYPLSSRQAIWLRSKARGGKIVDYLTDEQRSYGDKEPVELGADLQFGPLAWSMSCK